MRGILGVFLLATGLSLGAYSHYPGTTHRHQSLSELTEIITGSIARNVTDVEQDRSQQDRSQSATKAPPVDRGTAPPAHTSKNGATTLSDKRQDQWFAANLARTLAEAKASKTSSQGTEPAHRAVTTKRPTEAAPQLVSGPNNIRRLAAGQPTIVQSQGWRTAVIKVRETQAPATKRVTSLKPKTNKERWQLVTKLQGHLKRVGCYWGKVDGVWGRGSKRAIKAFMASVNASLPFKSPDYLMLNLLEGQKTAACQSPCGNGLQRAASGQCVAPQVIASLANRRKASDQRPSESATSSWQPTVTPKVKRHRVAALESSQEIKTTRRRPPPLPGRMAVGAAPRKPLAIREDTEVKPGITTPTAIKTQKPKKRATKPTVTAALTPDVTDDATPSPAQLKPVAASQQIQRAAQKKRRAATAAKKRKTRKRRYRSRRYGRSVRSLFTHPLGRM
jgi:hypothetical protein